MADLGWIYVKEVDGWHVVRSLVVCSGIGIQLTDLYPIGIILLDCIVRFGKDGQILEQ